MFFFWVKSHDFSQDLRDLRESHLLIGWETRSRDKLWDFTLCRSHFKSFVVHKQLCIKPTGFLVVIDLITPPFLAWKTWRQNTYSEIIHLVARHGGERGTFMKIRKLQLNLVKNSFICWIIENKNLMMQHRHILITSFVCLGFLKLAIYSCGKQASSLSFHLVSRLYFYFWSANNNLLPNRFQHPNPRFKFLNSVF